MARTYERETKHYDRVVLDHLVATGQATFFAAANTYVVKTEDGTFAVRPHQIVETPVVIKDVVEIRVPSPMDGYCGQEQYDGEDTGPGGVVYDAMLALAEEWISTEGMPGTDPLILVRKMLDDPQWEADIRAQVENGRRFTKRSWVSADEQDEILGYFGI